MKPTAPEAWVSGREVVAERAEEAIVEEEEGEEEREGDGLVGDGGEVDDQLASNECS